MILSTTNFQSHQYNYLILFYSKSCVLQVLEYDSKIANSLALSEFSIVALGTCTQPQEVMSTEKQKISSIIRAAILIQCACRYGNQVKTTHFDIKNKERKILLFFSDILPFSFSLCFSLPILHALCLNPLCQLSLFHTQIQYALNL